MRYDVFISYSSKDQKIVEGLSAYLEQHRIRCFVAYRDIPKGIAWARAIVEALDDSQMMVVVFSENFNQSEQVDREIELASEDRKPILTFRVTGDQFKGAKKYYLKNLNWIDAFPEPEKQFGALTQNIMKLLDIKSDNQERQTEEGKSFLTSSQTDEATDWLQKGIRYFNDKNYKEAIRCYEKSAKKHNKHALHNLAYFYFNGVGVPRDYTEAVRLYKEAIRFGSISSCSALGICYHFGLGVPQDHTEAVNLYKKAAEKGDASGQCNLGLCYQFGIGVDKNDEEAIKWMRKAAEKQDVKSLYYLGSFYQNGIGTKPDYNEAIKWYQKAAKKGSKEAQESLTKEGYTW